MVQLLLVPLFALMQGVAEPHFQAPDGQVGAEYKFTIPVSNPDKIKLSFKKVAGDLGPGITVNETGSIQGVPAAAGTSTFTIAVLWNNVELSRHDYTLKISAAKVQLVDPKAASVQLLPTPVPASGASDEVPPGGQTHMVLGFQQAGAAGADSTQKFFFDFYINRPLPWRNNQPGIASWWGDVRIASAPRQINSPVSLQAIISSAKSLKVNELAQSAEFLTGLDFRLGQISNTKVRSALSFIAGGGATGLLKADTSSNDQYYALNPADSDYARLLQKYPQAAKYEYIAFVPPARNQYDAEYFGGFRLVTCYAGGSPATISFTVGQNELVSGGELRGPVSRVEAFFPLSTGQSGLLSSIYLFGDAQLRLHAPQNPQPYNFTLATTGSTPANTLYVATPSNRDAYSIGLGLDLVKVLSFLNISVKTGK